MRDISCVEYLLLIGCNSMNRLQSVNSIAGQLIISANSFLCFPVYSLAKSTTNFSDKASLKLTCECVSKVSYSFHVRMKTGIREGRICNSWEELKNIEKNPETLALKFKLVFLSKTCVQITSRENRHEGHIY